MITISKSYSFDAGHQLVDPEISEQDNWRKFGKCSREHGHTYTLTVEVTGPINPKTGMVLNYFDLDDIVRPYVHQKLDHYNLNETFPNMFTTAENMVHEIGIKLNERIAFHPSVRLVSVTLSETPKTKAIWSPS